MAKDTLYVLGRLGLVLSLGEIDIKINNLENYVFGKGRVGGLGNMERGIEDKEDL